MDVLASADDLRSAVGREMGPSEWLTIDQDRVNTFADATGDHQWIHVDPDKAAQGPFKTTIAHGFLTLSLLPSLTAQVRRIDNASMQVNYGLDKVRFPAPVPVGSRVRASATITDAQEASGGVQLTTRVTVELEGSEKPACVADMLSRVFF